MYDFILENTQSDFLTLTIITVLNQAQREKSYFTFKIQGKSTQPGEKNEQ